MKTLSRFSLLLALALPALGATVTRIDTYITVSNTPANLHSLTFNGQVRTWTNPPVANPPTQLMVTNSPANAATNLMLHLQSYPFREQNSVSWMSETQLVIWGMRGSNVTVVAATNWATIEFRTNAAIQTPPVTMPFTTNETTAFRQWQMSMLATSLWMWATSGVPMGTTLMSNYLDAATAQLASNKILAQSYLSNSAAVLTNLLATNGALANMGLINTTNVSGILGNVTNGTLQGVKLTNAIIHATNGFMTNIFGDNWWVTNFWPSSTGTFSVCIGLGIADNYGVAVGVGTSSTNPYAISVGFGAHSRSNHAVSIGTAATGDGASVAIGSSSTAGGVASVALGNHAGTGAQWGTALGDYATATGENSVALGHRASAPNMNDFVLGNSSNWVQAPNLFTAPYATNLNLWGSNTISGNVGLQSSSVASMVAGANNLVIPTNPVVILSGPGAVWSLTGVSPGWVGRFHQLRNGSSYACTVVNESGLAAAAADRILTASGQDVTLGPGEWFALWYDIGATRWRLITYGLPPAIVSLTVSNLYATNITARTVTVNTTNGLSLAVWPGGFLSNAVGTAGQMMVDSTNLYICIEPNSWKRAALTW